MRTDILIIGGGLSGLTLAYRLAREQRSFLLIEARDRLGGRIFSQSAGDEAEKTNPRYDLGPAWVWPALQPLMQQLLTDLKLTVFAQYTQGAILYEDAGQSAPQRHQDPSAHGRSSRINGGAVRIIEQLTAALPAECLLLNRCAVRVIKQTSTVEVEMLDAQASRTRITADKVVLALPPRLLAVNMGFEPPLPATLRKLWRDTPTWMAGQAKVVVLYATPFWRTQGLSGEAYSRRGPLMEIHDASPAHGGPYALFGFPGISADTRRQLGEAELRRLCLAQLRRLFGDDALLPLAVLIKDWSDDGFTAIDDDRLAPAHHPDYGLMASERTLWNGQLIRAGSESAETSGGYVEGALVAAQAALDQITRMPR